jgi:nicotinate-nucleotide adenylyltransferase
MGIDSYMTITTWKDYKSIFELANLIVYNRPCFDINSLPKELLSYKNVYFIKEPTIGISSSFIRERLRQGKSCHFFIPKKALEYIQENMLYR